MRGPRTLCIREGLTHRLVTENGTLCICIRHYRGWTSWDEKGLVIDVAGGLGWLGLGTIIYLVRDRKGSNHSLLRNLSKLRYLPCIHMLLGWDVLGNNRLHRRCAVFYCPKCLTKCCLKVYVTK